ncbi:MAG TPA: hypothetical protein VHE34_16670 [Puia sp.]|uniref:hypothetical protein n=1 Tax=Puia sp. TaxID=2045100 RepID=UPI002C7C82B4|nr:hypothetical protein [Puia sp.]HVU96866.1 hypothetical protein [Puia sp.]
MPLSLASRKYMLILHLIFSVGWFGAVTAFFALAIAGVTGYDSQQVRSFYIALEPITLTWFESIVILVPGHSHLFFPYTEAIQ